CLPTRRKATEFEIITVMAFYHFANNDRCDIVLLEAGLGGRSDSTNVIYPLLSIITTIGHDHMQILGETLPEIAKEKAGIIKLGVPIITGVQQREAAQVIQEEAREKRSKIYQINEDFSVNHLSSKAEGELFSFKCSFGTMEEAFIPMKGFHQVHNAALALMGIYHLKSYKSFLIKEEDIREGLRAAFWVGRFEQIFSSPSIIIDGAHNPEGIESLLQTVQSHYQGKRITVIFSAVGDKRIDLMVEKLETIADHLIFTSFNFPRAVSAQILAEHSNITNKTVHEDWKRALNVAKSKLEEKDALIITGSLYFISEVRKYLKRIVRK
ncbi:cyanophycin synthetase, partial [Priestia megaterium]